MTLPECFQEQDARAALESPIEEEQQSPAAGPFNPIGVLSRRCSAASVASFHPSKMAAVNLWKTYVHRFDSIQKVVHLPSAEVVVFTAINDPSASSMEALALCFAIYYAAAVTLGPDQDDADDSDASSPCLDVDWGTSLDLFKMGLEQALAHADFLENPTLMLIQALAIYLVSRPMQYECIRPPYTLVHSLVHSLVHMLVCGTFEGTELG